MTRLLPATACALVFLAGCAKEKEKEAEAVVPVQVAEVARDSIRRIITADGVLRALDQSAVMPKISAPVTKFYVDRGDPVTKGELLATLENRDLAAAVADAKAAFQQAEASHRNLSTATVPDEVVKAQQDTEAAKQQLDAAQKLFESRQQLQREGALARRLVDEAAVALAQAKSQYETAKTHLASLEGVSRVEEVRGSEAQVASAKARVDAAEAQLSYSEIRSPIAGIVADRAIFPGEIAAAGSPLLTIVNVSSVIARVQVPQAQAPYVKVGQRARIAAADNVDAQGQVTVVSPAVDPNATTVEVWIQAPNPGDKLRPGGAIHATIFADTIPGAIVVPASAILPSSDGGVSVMVVGSDNLAHEHKVEVGVRTPEQAQILKGAQPGERVVVDGGVGLEDGAKVRIGDAKAGEKEQDSVRKKEPAKDGK